MISCANDEIKELPSNNKSHPIKVVKYYDMKIPCANDEIKELPSNNMC